jgi:hypothetical protein
VEPGCDDPQMVDDHQCHAKIGGKMPQQPDVGVETAG